MFFLILIVEHDLHRVMFQIWVCLLPLRWKSCSLRGSSGLVFFEVGILYVQHWILKKKWKVKKKNLSPFILFYLFSHKQVLYLKEDLKKKSGIVGRGNFIDLYKHFRHLKSWTVKKGLSSRMVWISEYPFFDSPKN